MFPRVKHIKPISPIILRIIFSSSIPNKEKILNPEIYQFNHGLETEGVVIVNDKTIDLITSPQETDKPYRLTINA